MWSSTTCLFRIFLFFASAEIYIYLGLAWKTPIKRVYQHKMFRERLNRFWSSAFVLAVCEGLHSAELVELHDKLSTTPCAWKKGFVGCWDFSLSQPVSSLSPALMHLSEICELSASPLLLLKKSFKSAAEFFEIPCMNLLGIFQFVLF